MEVQLQELIDKIKSNGVQSAKDEGAKIVSAARAEAVAIVAKAKAEASELLQKAEETVARNDKSGREALQLAARDLLLNLNERITSLFNASMTATTASAMDKEHLSSLIKTVLSTLNSQNAFVISLSEKDAITFGEALKAELASLAKAGIEIKPTRGIDAGFRIEEKNGAIAYDFSSNVIAENLSAYVNPKLAEDIKKAANLS